MISVIIPIYNAESYLQECLQSVRCQTYKDLQIILVDDGSTDSSYNIANQAAQVDKRILLLKQPNQGQGAARNLGLQYATAEWISFVDADDFLTPDFYESLLPQLQSSACDILQFGFQQTDSQSGNGKKHFPRHKCQYTTPWSKIYKRQFLQENNLIFPDIRAYEDVVFSVRCWKLHPKIQPYRYAGYKYRINPTSTTSRMRDTRPVFRELRTELRLSHSARGIFITIYTCTRLRLHFLLNGK